MKTTKRDLANFMARTFWDCMADPQGPWKKLTPAYKNAYVMRMGMVLDALEAEHIKLLPQSPSDETLKQAAVSRYSYVVNDYARIWDASEPRPVR